MFCAPSPSFTESKLALKEENKVFEKFASGAFLNCSLPWFFDTGSLTDFARSDG